MKVSRKSGLKGSTSLQVAVQAGVFAGATERPGAEVVLDARAFRLQEIAIANANFERRSTESDEGAAKVVGQSLINKLGL